MKIRSASIEKSSTIDKAANGHGLTSERDESLQSNGCEDELSANNLAVLQRDFQGYQQLLGLYESVGGQVAKAAPEVKKQIDAVAEDIDVRGQVLGFVRRFGDELAAGLRAESALAPISDARAQVWAHGIAGMVQAAGDWWLGHPDVPREVVVDELIALMFGEFGLGTPPT